MSLYQIGRTAIVNLSGGGELGQDIDSSWDVMVVVLTPPGVSELLSEPNGIATSGFFRAVSRLSNVVRNPKFFSANGFRWSIRVLSLDT